MSCLYQRFGLQCTYSMFGCDLKFQMSQFKSKHIIDSAAVRLRVPQVSIWHDCNLVNVFVALCGSFLFKFLQKMLHLYCVKIWFNTFYLGCTAKKNGELADNGVFF